MWPLWKWHGRPLDSTNVCRSHLTAITTIGLDHVAFAGAFSGSDCRAEGGDY